MNKKPEANYDEYLEDAELWETRQLGADPKYARRVSASEDKALDDSLGLQAISIRLQKELVEQLKSLAKRDGIGYQPYIRQLLSRHVRDTLSASQEKRATA